MIDLSADVINHVNFHVAHLDKDAKDSRPATFEQLDGALDSLDGLVKKYRLELEAVQLMDPVLAGPWLEIFRVPWLPD